MNTKISISNITKIVNILFLIVLENFVLDCGMGFFSATFLFIAIFYTVLFSGLQTGISKMVSIRNNKGLNSNARRILKPAVLYVGMAGAILFLLVFFFGTTFCTVLWKTPYPTPILQSMCLVLLLTGITDTICGYQNGNGNGIVSNIANVLRMILPIPLSFFFLPVFTKYGEKISALLKNTSATSAYMALAIACIYLVTSLLVLFVVIFLSIRLRYPHKEGRNMRTMDSKKLLYGGIFTTAFKISLNQIFPLLSVAMIALIYLQTASKYTITPEHAFINIGVLFVKLALPIAFILAIFSEYISREKYRLYTDYRKDDPKTALIRTQYMIKNSFFMLLPPSVILTFLADPFVKVFFSGQYAFSAKVLQAGGFLVLFAGFAYTLSAIMKASGMEFQSFAIQVISFLVQIVILVLFFNNTSGNSIGMIYSFYLFFGIQIVLDFILLYRILRFDWMDILMKLGKYGAASIVMMILFIILDKFVMMNVFLMLLSMFFGYLLYYLTLLALKGISKKDEGSLKRTLNYYPVAFLKSRLRL